MEQAMELSIAMPCLDGRDASRSPAHGVLAAILIFVTVSEMAASRPVFTSSYRFAQQRS